jgi:predicted ABC-type ATPase
MSKTITVVAGPNGSGKTTFAETFLNEVKALPYLNPDLIAIGFGPSDFEKASFVAGRVLLSDIKSKIQRGESFCFESTLSGLTYARILDAAKKQGYSIQIYFIGLKLISLNLSRIKKRVEQGGHHIPTKVVKRRHLRCYENFWKIYKVISDDWSILDNSGKRPRLIHNKKSFSKLAKMEQEIYSMRFLKGRP